LFIVTSAFLFLMGIKFIGEAMQEFQEQTIVSFTPLPGFGWMETIGLNPTLEAVSAQLLVILFAVASFAVVRRNNRLVRRDKAARTA
jgi:high-affinity iron transporter